ncbi:MAG TPA: hypothetical protein VIH11_06720, partial [Gemmatimonadaceae bacterium]
QPIRARDDQRSEQPVHEQRASQSGDERQPATNATALFPSSGAVYGHGGRTGQRDGRRASRERTREVPVLLGGFNRRGG